jgi:hypothetical protein
MVFLFSSKYRMIEFISQKIKMHKKIREHCGLIEYQIPTAPGVLKPITDSASRKSPRLYNLFFLKRSPSILIVGERPFLL